MAALLPEFVYSSNIKPKVAIVGAGLAGLNAANYLKKAGIRAEIFEANSGRAGGRIFTDHSTIVPGLTAEIGGEFIDSNHTEMFKLMSEFGLKPKDVEGDHLFFHDRKESFFINDRFYSEEEVTKTYNEYKPRIRKDFRSCGENYDTADAKRLDNLSISAYLDSVSMDSWLKKLLESSFCSEYGMDPDYQSSINLLSMIGTDEDDPRFKMYNVSDEVVNIDGGNDSIIKALVHKLQDQIHYGFQLSAIKKNGTKYDLSFRNQKDLSFDFIIICIPFSVLRQVDLTHSGLSSAKQIIIQNLGYGTNSKVIMGFNSRIWRTDFHATGYCFNETINNGWDASRMQHGNEGPGIYTCLIGGKSGQVVADKKNDRVFLEGKYLNQLDRIYSGCKKSYNHKMIIADWPNKINSAGSYACYKTGQWTNIHFGEVIPENNIYFAGEHCSQLFQGFMNGAAETGKQAAIEIIKRLV